MKTKNTFSLLLLFFVLFGTACEYFSLPADFPDPECTTGEPFRLWYGQSAACENWEVTFTGEIQDSRCPATVTCVWAGRVDIEIEVGTEMITLGLPDDSQLGRAKDTLGNQVIELLEVLPIPVIADPIPKESYRIKLSVTDL